MNEELNTAENPNVDVSGQPNPPAPDPVLTEELDKLEQIQIEREEKIAKICHRVNRAYCQSLKDDSQPSWENAPDWQKRTMVNGVRFHLDNLDATAAAGHDKWMDEKRKEGWTYGAIKNVELKQHPCFLKFDDIPTEFKAKDFIFKTLVNSLSQII